jgi:hypothetical protein
MLEPQDKDVSDVGEFHHHHSENKETITYSGFEEDELSYSRSISQRGMKTRWRKQESKGFFSLRISFEILLRHYPFTHVIIKASMPVTYDVFVLENHL